MESESVSRASLPLALDDTKVLSQRASPGHEAVQEAGKTALEGNTLVAENTRVTIPSRDDGGGLDQSDHQPDTAPETQMAPEPNKQSSLREGGVPTPTATSASLEAPNTLMEALQRASIMEKHRTLMGAQLKRFSLPRTD